MEVWKTIEGTNGKIEVSNEGRVRSLLRGTPRILKTQPDSKGYLRLRVTIDRVKFGFKVHREVAKAFIDNPDNLPQVNHIDGNKSNNAVTNLEWITNKDNAHHAIANGLWENVFTMSKKANDRKKIPVIAINEKDHSIIRFDSVSDAQRYFDSRHISDVLKGKRRTCKGYLFRREEVTA